MNVDWARLPPPQPQPSRETEGFWKALAEGTLALCRCTACGLWQHPPLERCRSCAGVTTFEPVSGSGVISTFIIQRQPAVVGYFDRVPYAVAIVELDEQAGLRLTGRVVDVDVDDIEVGMRVRARIEALAGGHFRVPVWAPDPTPTSSEEQSP